VTNNHESALYRLDRILDDPRVEGFVFSEEDDNPLLPDRGNRRVRGRKRDFWPSFPKSAGWTVSSLKDVWRAPRVRGRVRSWLDFTSLNFSLPVFSARAVDALRELLEPHGEILPLIYEPSSFFVYNCRTVVEAVDVARSKVSSIVEDNPLSRTFDEYEVHQDRIRDSIIFRDYHDDHWPLVTQPFVDRVLATGLRGFVFDKIWPWPRGSRWQLHVRQQRQDEAKRRKSGMNTSREAGAETVVIRLFTGNKRKPSKDQREQVSMIMDTLDAVLFDPTGNAEDFAGSLIGDEPVNGEHRLFIACPDADRCIDYLKSWLENLDWAMGFSVFKRYGPLHDEAAHEVRVF
jgi:hypothetical protein